MSDCRRVLQKGKGKLPTAGCGSLCALPGLGKFPGAVGEGTGKPGLPQKLVMTRKPAELKENPFLPLNLPAPSTTPARCWASHQRRNREDSPQLPRAGKGE